ncbi:Acetylornithine/succinyldiaminopimelate aminotransferase [Serratia plymuthica]|uniref:Acetylornithine/succinyldiaminopimelate aminotransferase n=1 Tax=Serratia plymuthica TaxID=82996 RepID=A0A2X4UUU6_SERPL|nr:Acetylornithine/succinyldiaminopimelate aminotransferase [Serratia plymuthica]
MIALIAGPDVVRFTPSLIIPEQDVKEGLARFARAVARICS